MLLSICSQLCNTASLLHVCLTGGRAISSDAAFHILQGAVQAAQAQVLAADGTLTTLVGAVVLQQRMRSGKHCCLSVVIGDSPAYVWRAAGQEVVELNYQSPLHGFHRWADKSSAGPYVAGMDVPVLAVLEPQIFAALHT
jgi:hypothetical protein